MMEGQLFTWEALSAMGGASLLTYFVVQYTKSLIDRFAARWLPTDLYAVMVASAILLLAQLAIGANATDWRVYVLAVANGFLVAAAAGQMQRKAVEPPGRKEGGSE
jgi:divalent metal cation (Fe/Co/Zn/Cd) transporter